MAVPEPVPELGPLLGVWRAHDDAFEHVMPTWWGAVVSDRRYPAINEANYARVEARRPVRLAEIEAEHLPAGPRSHVVVFHPEDQTDLLSEVGTRGERIVWDLVMVHRGPVPDRGGAEPVSDHRTEEIRRFDDAFWRAHAESTRLFDVDDRGTLEQLRALERETLIPLGRRWFAVSRDGGPVAFASLLVTDATGYLDHVVTFPEARRRGYAEALTRRALSAAAAAGATSTFLLADPGGRAERIYRRIGFEPVAHLASWTSERRR
ncbi:MAG TPA: GNAT family N-acetyltransferase [Actinomycetota bacterium]|nr:GNAT family N-acetyltransferase [Actinomycetota bacterium]